MRGAKAAIPAAAALPSLPPCVRASADGGATLAVHAKPGSKRAAVVAVAAALEVAIDAPAREGEANEALIEFLAEQLKVKKRHITLRSGGKSREKVFNVQLAPAELAARLLGALPKQ